MECEQRRWVEIEGNLLWAMVDAGGVVDELALPVATFAANSLIARLMAMGRKEEAKKQSCRCCSSWTRGLLI